MHDTTSTSTTDPDRSPLPDLRLRVVHDVATGETWSVRVCGIDASTTVAEVIAATGVALRPADRAVLIDGAAVPVHRPVCESGVRDGSTLAPLPAERPPAHRLVCARWIAGPDAARTVELTAATHFIGRASSATLRADCPALALHHAAVHVDAAGRVTVEQLAGSRPIRIDRDGASSTVDGVADVGQGEVIRIGVHGVEVGRVQRGERPPRRGAADRWRDEWSSAPATTRPRADETAVVVPPAPAEEPPSGPGSVLPGLLGVAASAALALVLGQPMLLAFGALGAIVALGTWCGHRVTTRRRRNRLRRDDDLAVAAALAEVAERCRARRVALRGHTMTAVGAADVIESRDPALWSAEPDDDARFPVCLGDGEVEWLPELDGWDRRPELWPRLQALGRLGRGPIVTDLVPGTVLAIVGAHADAVARSIVVQLAASAGPATWRLQLLSGDRARWPELRWLPHLGAAGDIEGVRRVVRVVDGSARSLRGRAIGDVGLTEIVVCAGSAEVPRDATAVLSTERDGVGRWIADAASSGMPLDIEITGVSARRTEELAASLAGLTDARDRERCGALPMSVPLAGVLDLPLGDPDADLPAAITRRWAAAPSTLATPLGVDAAGSYVLDLDRDGPHALLAGTTGAGKSELLRTLVCGLAATYPPDRVSFVLIDYKGGAAFDACADLPHVVGSVTDLDGDLADRATVSLEAELRRREALLRHAGATDLHHYDRLGTGRAPATPIARLVVIVDEFATLATRQPAFITGLVDIARRGRSLGVHLVLATQRPHGVITDDMRANVGVRIALRVHDASDSLDVIGDARAAGLPRHTPGRAVVRGADDTLTTVQVATSSAEVRRRRSGVTVRRLGSPDDGAEDASHDERALDDGSTELAHLVRAIREATRVAGVTPAHRPWLEPLTPEMELPDVPGAVGVVDDPANQARHPLVWLPDGGHLLLVGGPASGRTTTLAQIGRALVPPDSAGETRTIVIDAGGSRGADAAEDAWPFAAAVIDADDRERLLRVLSMPIGPPRGVDRLVLLIDGLDLLRSRLESDGDWTCLDLLDRVITDGTARGISVAASVRRAQGLPLRLLTAFPRRWVFALDDPLDAAVLGLRAADVPDGPPGRCVDSTSGCRAQVLRRDDLRTGGEPGGRSRPNATLERLPTHLPAERLPTPVCGGGATALPLGVGFRDLEPVTLPLVGGEHVLVVGPSRSGRSSALALLAEQWQRAHPGGWVVSLPARRTSVSVGDACGDVAQLLGRLAAQREAGRRVLVLIDDAELVPDPSGALAALVDARDEALSVIAAGRADNLRASYGHWTASVRRSRLGLVMAGAGELDGDLLGAALPRRCPIDPRPGLAWLIADGRHDLVQVAVAQSARRAEDALSSSGVCLGS